MIKSRRFISILLMLTMLAASALPALAFSTHVNTTLANRLPKDEFVLQTPVSALSTTETSRFTRSSAVTQVTPQVQEGSAEGNLPAPAYEPFTSPVNNQPSIRILQDTQDVLINSLPTELEKGSVIFEGDKVLVPGIKFPWDKIGLEATWTNENSRLRLSNNDIVINMQTGTTNGERFSREVDRLEVRENIVYVPIAGVLDALEDVTYEIRDKRLFIHTADDDRPVWLTGLERIYSHQEIIEQYKHS